MFTKKLFHTLNERAKRKQREQEEREHELYLARALDPRRDLLGQDLTRIYPLIEDES
jgi:hypothetical protein